MEISNPDKVLFPETGLTKADLVGHYESVGERMLPFVARSPLTLERYPNGIDTKGFRQKNASKHFPDDLIERIEIPKRDGGTTVYPAVDSVDGLLYLANQGTVTFHPWTSRRPHLDSPGHLVLDLDPDEGDLGGVREVAHAARDVMERFGLSTTPVASGSKGFHLWAAIEVGPTFDVASRCARALASLIAHEHERATTEFLKQKRAGRVFIDWLRNNPGSSIASPFSVRARPRAPVATPLPWSAIDSTAPDEWTIESFDDRPDVAFDQARPLRDTEIIAAATEAGIDLDATFDRFGRS